MEAELGRMGHEHMFAGTAAGRTLAAQRAVAILVAPEPPSSRGLGRRPLTAETGVRIPVAVLRCAPVSAQRLSVSENDAVLPPPFVNVTRARTFGLALRFSSDLPAAVRRIETVLCPPALISNFADP